MWEGRRRDRRMKFLTWLLLVVKKCKKVLSQIIIWWLGGEKIH